MSNQSKYISVYTSWYLYLLQIILCLHSVAVPVNLPKVKTSSMLVLKVYFSYTSVYEKYVQIYLYLTIYFLYFFFNEKCFLLLDIDNFL